MHDSAVAIVRERSRRAARRAAAPPPARRPCCRRRRTACRRGARARPPRTPRRRALGVRLDSASRSRSRRVCRHVVISRRLELHALALGHAQRLGDLRLGDPEQPQRPLRVGGRAARSPRAARRCRAPRATSAAARAAGRAAPRPSGRARPVAAGGTTSPGAVPDGLEHRRAAGTVACLRLAAPDRLRVDVRPAPGAAARRSRRCAARAPRRAPSRGPGSARPPRLSDRRRSGPSPPLVRIRSSPCAAMKPQRRAHVLRAVADDRRVGEIDAELAQPVRQPRAVAVAARGREHLGARHHDPGARAHARASRARRAGALAAAACWRPRALVIE